MRVKVSKGTASTLRMLKDWKKRARSYMDYNLYNLVDHVQEDVVSRLPGEAAELGKSMQMVRVTGATPSYLLRFQPVAQAVEKDEQNSVILEVVSKRPLIEAPRREQILVDYSPWTLDTLPYTPSLRFATVVKRKVSEGAVRRVRKERKRDKSWRQEMYRAGIRVPRVKKAGSVKAVSDLRLQSVTLEFGLGGAYKPHWRPAISKNMRRFSRSVKKDRTARKILNDPNFKGWTKWPLPLAHKVSPAGLTPYQGFQKTLGIL